jgi:hypothetical protein
MMRRLKTMANWDDNFKKMYENKLKISSNREWRFSIEEHKKRGTIQMNVRKFQVAEKEGDYEGATKSGFIEGLESKEQLEQFQKYFNDMFEEAKKFFD